MQQMKRTIAGLLLLLSLSAVAVGQAQGVAAKSTSKDEEAIRNVLADFVAAWNKHDAAAFSQVFAEDADFTNVRGTSAHGRAEVEKFHAPLFATRFKDSKQAITNVRVRFIKPDVAAGDAWWEMTGARDADGKERPLRKGLLNFVMTAQGGKWLIAVMHNMDLPE